MPRTPTRTDRNGTARQIVGLGFLPVEARHGFLIEVPKRTGRNDFICFAEHRNVDLSRLSLVEQASSLLSALTQSQAGSLSHVEQASCLLIPSSLPACRHNMATASQPSLDGNFRRRNLPHLDVEGKPIFITACLNGSSSASGLTRIRKYRDELEEQERPVALTEEQWQRKKHKLLFQLVDDLLDHLSPVTHLRDPQQARIVRDAFLHFADERYTLLAFVIMPSHHDWLFLPRDPSGWKPEPRGTGFQPVASSSQSEMMNPGKRTPREIISHSIQSYTATMCNRCRGATGNYWQTETFDHWARDEAEALRIIRYIEQNPVVAKLVERPEQWPWSSARLRAQYGIAAADAIRTTHVPADGD